MDSQVGAASTSLHHLLTSASRDGVVRHVGRRRAAVEVDGRLVVLTDQSRPSTLPCSVIVPRLDVARLGPVGRTLRVGHGPAGPAVGDVRVVRWWDPTTVRTGVRSAATGVEPDVHEPPDDILDRRTLTDLREAAALISVGATAGATDDATGLLVGVLGRGRGSTPDADDAVAGLLLAARALLSRPRTSTLSRVAAAVADAAPGRTTLLSAELLRLAALGAACPAVVRHVTRPAAATRAAVLALGATSGAATLAGVDVATTAFARTGHRPEVAA